MIAESLCATKFPLPRFIVSSEPRFSIAIPCLTSSKTSPLSHSHALVRCVWLVLGCPFRAREASSGVIWQGNKKRRAKNGFRLKIANLFVFVCVVFMRLYRFVST